MGTFEIIAINLSFICLTLFIILVLRMYKRNDIIIKNEKELYQEVIHGVIDAKSGSDLKILLDKINEHQWYDSHRKMFLMGLLQGTVMQFNKDVSIKELKELFFNI